MAILAGMAAMPLLALLIAEAAHDRARTLKDARISLFDAVREGAARQGDMLHSAALLVDLLAHTPSVAAATPGVCPAMLRAIVSDHPGLAAIGVARPDGTVVCHSDAAALGQKFIDPTLLRNALAGDAPATLIGRGLMCPITHTLVMIVARPLAGGGGHGVVYAGIDAGWFGRLAASLAGKNGGMAMVVDPRDGMILAASPDPGRQIGTRLADRTLLQAFGARPQGGVAESTDAAGHRWIDGFAPLPDSGGGAVLVVASSRHSVLREPNHRLMLDMVLALAAMIATIGCAWLASSVTAIRPLRGMMHAARCMAAGDLSARVPSHRRRSRELNELGNVLNDMAAHLAAREAQLLAAREETARGEAALRVLADNTTDIVLRIDARLRPVYISPSSLERLGYAPEEFLRQDWRTHVHPEDWARMADARAALRNAVPTLRMTYRGICKDGAIVWLEGAGQRIGANEGYVVTIRDITHIKQAEAALADSNRKLEAANEVLQTLAARDGLTGLANRRHLNVMLDRETRRAARDHQPLALLMIDVDFFKSFNDNYGHPAGDSCLCELAGIIQTLLRRPGDLVARYGGEEIAVLLPNTGQSGAFIVAREIMGALRARAIPHRGSPGGTLTVSIGTAAFVPAHADDAALLLAYADRALYAAKRSGRNCVRTELLPVHPCDDDGSATDTRPEASMAPPSPAIAIS